MKTRSSCTPLWMLVAIVLGAACTGGTAPPAAEAEQTAQAGSGDPSSTSRAPQTLPIPGQASPPGESAAGAGPAGRLVWDVPEGWRVEQPSSSMRRAQYRVTGPGGDAECVVFYFGPGQGGDAASNAARWAGQFSQPDGGSAEERMQTTRLETARLPVQLVEVTGTYDGGMTMTDQPAEPKPGYMLLGAIVEGSDAPWFFKFTGPEQTIRARRQEFVGLMNSIRSGG